MLPLFLVTVTENVCYIYGNSYLKGTYMKDVNDNQTQDLLPTRRPRGRPRTGTAKTPAQKQAAYRQRLAENTVTVTFNRADIPAIKLLLANPNPALQLDQETLDRIAGALFTAAIRSSGTKEQGR